MFSHCVVFPLFHGNSYGHATHNYCTGFLTQGLQGIEFEALNMSKCTLTGSCLIAESFVFFFWGGGGGMPLTPKVSIANALDLASPPTLRLALQALSFTKCIIFV